MKLDFTKITALEFKRKFCRQNVCLDKEGQFFIYNPTNGEHINCSLSAAKQIHHELGEVIKNLIK